MMSEFQSFSTGVFVVTFQCQRYGGRVYCIQRTRVDDEAFWWSPMFTHLPLAETEITINETASSRPFCCDASSTHSWHSYFVVHEGWNLRRSYVIVVLGQTRFNAYAPKFIRPYRIIFTCMLPSPLESNRNGICLVINDFNACRMSLEWNLGLYVDRFSERVNQNDQQKIHLKAIIKMAEAHCHLYFAAKWTKPYQIDFLQTTTILRYREGSIFETVVSDGHKDSSWAQTTNLHRQQAWWVLKSFSRYCWGWL